MKFKFDHDLHIHSMLSPCSADAEQNKENILSYAKKNRLNKICLTDHFWDSAVNGTPDWYSSLNYEYISKSKPLPQAENIQFMFGCETDMDKSSTLGISNEKFEKFDFVIIPTTHLHMKGVTISEEDASLAANIAKVWTSRLECLLNMDLPFNKIGIAHLACGLIASPREKYLDVLNLIPSVDMERLFAKAAQLNVGIELNLDDMNFSEDEKEIVLRPFKIAKYQGCKFYLGSDAHHPKSFEIAKTIFERAIDCLDLQESDKFDFVR